MNGRGYYKAGQAGCSGHLAASRDRPGPSLRSFLFLLPAGGYKSITEKTTAAAAAADAGVVFYQYGATGINAVGVLGTLFPNFLTLRQVPSRNSTKKILIFKASAHLRYIYFSETFIL